MKISLLLTMLTVLALCVPVAAQDTPVSPLPTPEPEWIVDPNNPCGGMVPAQCHVFSMSYQVFFPLIGGSNE